MTSKDYLICTCAGSSPFQLLSAAEMQRADAAAIASGIDGFELMTAAGRAVARTVRRHHPVPCRVVVVAGGGNNGGDGAVVARLLDQAGFGVTLIKVGSGVPTQADARRAFDQWCGESLAVDDGRSLATIEAADVIIDALLGAGLNRDLDGTMLSVVKTINRAPAPVISIDLPSGIDGNRCCVRGAAVKADHTVTFFRYKPAHLLYPGRTHCGTLELAQIGIPDQVLPGGASPRCYLNDPALWQARLPAPAATGHKFERGHVMVRGGPIHQAGAARLSALTALHCGAGLVSLATPSTALAANAAQLTAVMLKGCENSLDWQELISDVRVNTVVIGPGNGIGASTSRCVEAALGNGKACVIDADALTSFARQPDTLFRCLADRDTSVVLTPHAGEFLRLFPDITVKRFGSRLEQARAAAERAGAVVVFKGPDTVVAAPGGCAVINANAPPWLATAGAGDVLAGLVGGLLAQGMDAFDAANAGVWLHGDAAARTGYPMCAEQLVTATGEALGMLVELAAPSRPLGLPPIARTA